ncbi:hypothetical protein SM124_14600 [Bacillus sp. 31A1R]|uniref:Lipoprotein n=1 Tax=Robertmurraya mangrovi TaxID=3098077 RepID=A0ABU5J0S0_9BACI|nr:hypothetical protein [Bacillus sp. 31A1R]MDZ5472945.1 hypothetical protein [Bacillus sp. 31A1R]
MVKSKKGLKFVFCLFTFLFLLSGCSSKPSVELVSSKVEIRDDESRMGGIAITTGDKKGKIIIPVGLSYDFVLKNNGKKTLGGTEKLNEQTFDYDDGIKVTVVPNEKFEAVLKEIMGINIFHFDKEGRQVARLGTGESGVPTLEPNKEGTYTFDFILGAKEENPELRLAPSEKQLKILEKHAMDVTLIITVKGKEIDRFDLSKLD